MNVEVEVQPDREHAERDDAAVDVAAHVFLRVFRAASSAPRALPVAAFASAVRRRCGQDFGCSGI